MTAIILLALPFTSADGPLKIKSKKVQVAGMSCLANNDVRAPQKTAPAIVYYPEEAGKYPVLSFAHGVFSGAVADYSGTMGGVASHGFIVVGMLDCSVALSMYHDQIRALEYILTEDADLAPIVDRASATGVFGHSMGGAATLNSASDAASVQRVNLSAAVAMHPGIQLGKLTPHVPTLYFTGSVDPLCGPLITHPMYLLAAAAGISRGYAVVKGYNHLNVMGPRTNKEVDYVAAWFSCYLRRDAASCDLEFSTDQASCAEKVPDLCACDGKPTVKKSCETVQGKDPSAAMKPPQPVLELSAS